MQVVEIKATAGALAAKDLSTMVTAVKVTVTTAISVSLLMDATEITVRASGTGAAVQDADVAANATVWWTSGGNMCDQQHDQYLTPTAGKLLVTLSAT